MSDTTATSTTVIDPQTGELVDASVASAPVAVDSSVATSIPDSLAKAISDGISSTEGQSIEAEIISGLPKWARGTVYAGIGALSTAAGSILGFAVQYPGVIPAWLVATATVAAAPLGAIVASTAFASLGKK